jgi:hypothetical protein
MTPLIREAIYMAGFIFGYYILGALLPAEKGESD